MDTYLKQNILHLQSLFEDTTDVGFLVMNLEADHLNSIFKQERALTIMDT